MFTKEELWEMSTFDFYSLKRECYWGYEDWYEYLDHSAVYINKKRYQPILYIEDAWRVWENESRS